MSGWPAYDGATLLGNWNRLREPRIGVLLHYDGSLSDRGALAWLREDARCTVSYNWIITDDGGQVTVAPETARAWHAGTCRSSDPIRLPYRDANSAFYGVAIAATAGERVTPRQFDAVVRLCRALFDFEGWDRVAEAYRVQGHGAQAWPRGRKVDPLGPDPAHPVLDPATVRAALAA